MIYVKKEEAIAILDKLIVARQKRTCNRQSLVEKTAFEYCKQIINQLEEKEIED